MKYLKLLKKKTIKNTTSKNIPEANVESSSSNGPLSQVLLAAFIAVLGVSASSNSPSATLAGRCVLLSLYIIVALVAIDYSGSKWRFAVFLGAGLCPFISRGSEAVAIFVLPCLAAMDRREFSRAAQIAILVSLLLFIDETGRFWCLSENAARSVLQSLFNGLFSSSNQSPIMILGVWLWIGVACVAFAMREGSARLRIVALPILILGSALSLLLSLNWPLIGTCLLLGSLLSHGAEPTVKNALLHGLPPIAIVVAPALAFLIEMPSVSKNAVTSVAFLDGGLKTLNLDTRPLGSRQSEFKPEFGAFVKLLERRGSRIKVLKENFNKQELYAVNILFAINQGKNLGSGQIHSIKDFVARGGRLVVLGDHTNIFGTRDATNQILGFTSIRLNFDSAVPLPSHPRWTKSMQSGLYPSFWRQPNSQIGISVGASLLVKHPARTVVRGIYGYSDAGSLANAPNGLGDMTRDPSEWLGNVPLVAEQRFGKGLIQVWGDTSGFQNGSAFTNYEWLDSYVQGIAAEQTSVPVGTSEALLIFAVLAALLPGSVRNKILAVSACFFIIRVIEVTRVDSISGIEVGRHLLYDASHMPLYPGLTGGEYLSKFSSTALKAVDLPVTEYRFRPRNLETVWWVIQAPLRSYSRSEAIAIRDYVSSGGRLLLATGVKEEANVRNLLDLFGATIDPAPLGPANQNQILRPEDQQFVIDFPEKDGSRLKRPAGGNFIRFLEAYGVNCPGSLPIVSCWGKHLVVKKKLGQGFAIIVGDSRFLTDALLGEGFETNTENCRFLYRLLEK